MANNLPTLAPQNMTEAMEFSKMLSRSSMVPQAYRGKDQDILVAVQWGYEVGLQPMQALQNIAVINGKPSIYGDAALALVKAHPLCRGVTERIEGEGDQMRAVCIVKRAYPGGEIEETMKTFSVENAKRARLWGKQGPWSQYPERMLTMRARGFAIRDAFPDAMKGIITQEEAADMPTEPKDITPQPQPVNQLDQISAPESDEPEVVEVDTSEVIEAAPAAPEPEQSYTFTLVGRTGQQIEQPTTDPEVYGNGLLKMFHTAALAERDREGNPINERDRMSLLKQLKEANQEGIDQMPEDIKQIVADGYRKELKTLGAKLNGPS